MTSTSITVHLFDTQLTAAWAGHVDQVIITVRSGDGSLISWQKSVEEATSLRDQLTAAIEESGGAKCVPCGGRGLIRFDGGGLSRCEDCEGEGVVSA